MHKFKNAMAILMASAILFAFAGCGKSKETTKETKEETKKEQTEKEDEDTKDSESDEGKSAEESKNEEMSTFDEAMDAISQDFAGYVKEKLGNADLKFNEADGSTLSGNNRFNGKYSILSEKEEPRLDCWLFDSEKDALNFFVDTYYTPFNASFQKDRFQGEYDCVLEDGHGYIVVYGKDLGTNIFGDGFRSEKEACAGVYYKGNTVVLIMTKNSVTNTRINEVIKLLGLPTAEGKNV